MEELRAEPIVQCLPACAEFHLNRSYCESAFHKENGSFAFK